ncbi:hypothetical protein HELRODRAFT_167311 [Helobdella robusta]|uniref:Peptidase M12B propeptide domain-containing protein n=1 Tax=Helobdella robusta TaxID=6412 RepID=T1EZ90_HELRO|nr:hypothetical protein HELRODRAFT_167311 [Helobdella robusta]ESO10812.1 hypothetical protein HELRODRAFT_167311 [Helobdella robusta]
MIVKKLLLYIFALTGLVCSELGERINRYDLFHHDQVRHHISKRDVYIKFPDTRRLEFNSLGKNFKLELKKETSLFTSDFRVTVINGQGSKKTVDILPNLYHGHVQGDPTSKVEAMFHRDDLFTGKPSWRHIPHDTNSTMIGYKENDVNYKFDLGTKRETSSTCTKDNKVCTLMLVAEYNFFKNMGNGDVEATTGYMISVIDQVNQIYSRTAFGGCGTGFQFEIREAGVVR